MAAKIVSSKVAIDASILLVRSFVKMRTMLSEHIELRRRLLDVERGLAQGFAQHEDEPLRPLDLIVIHLKNDPDLDHIWEPIRLSQ